MKKAASINNPSKKAVSKTLAKAKSTKVRTVKVKSTSAVKRSPTLIESYYLQTDQFFLAHPNARVLLGIFIVVYAIFLAAFLRNKVIAFGMY